MNTPQHNNTTPAGISARLVKVPQAAEMLALSIPTLRRLIKRGEIRVNRKTRHCLIPISEVERFASA
jgi:excisionase family DNA binding protein